MPEFLIVGATGQQGGAVVDALIEAIRRLEDIQIRALTRNASSPQALKLAEKGVKLYEGDLSNKPSLKVALQGCNGAYLVTDFRSPGGVRTEIDNGIQFIDVAREVGVGHLVFSSVAGAGLTEGIVDHFHSKYAIETHLRQSFSDRGQSWTIIRPVGFFDVIPGPGLVRSMFMSAMAALLGEVSQAYVSCRDIGRVCAEALLHPIDQNGKLLHLAAQKLTTSQLRAELDKASGGSTWILWIPRWLILVFCSNDYRQMFEWLSLGLQPADIGETRTIIPNVLSAYEWERWQQNQKR